MTAKIQRWFRVIVFLLTREDSTISIHEKRRACLYLSSNTPGLGTIKALVWMMIAIVFCFSLCLL